MIEPHSSPTPANNSIAANTDATWCGGVARCSSMRLVRSSNERLNPANGNNTSAVASAGAIPRVSRGDDDRGECADQQRGESVASHEERRHERAEHSADSDARCQEAGARLAEIELVLGEHHDDQVERTRPTRTDRRRWRARPWHHVVHACAMMLRNTSRVAPTEPSPCAIVAGDAPTTASPRRRDARAQAD